MGTALLGLSVYFAVAWFTRLERNEVTEWLLVLALGFLPFIWIANRWLAAQSSRRALMGETRVITGPLDAAVGILVAMLIALPMWSRIIGLVVWLV